MVWIRSRLSYSNVVATVALFAALGGGAYAATSGSLLGSDGAIKGCVAKKGGALRVVKPNKKCPKHKVTLSFNAKGQNGAPGAPGRSALTPLGAGEAESGTWGTAGDVTSGSHLLISAQTFPIPLAAGLDSNHVVYVTAASAAHCPGVGQAEAGYLCVYQTVGVDIVPLLTVVNKPTADYGNPGTDRNGFIVFLYTMAPGSVEGFGTWTVSG